jgi:protein-L-isoaspartate(D-aspartate) O-methyltransferase
VSEGEQTLALREQLLDTLLTAGHLHSERVTAASRAVPRHVFLPEIDPRRAYRDEALPTKWDASGQPISSSSQPAIMAAMLEQLGVEPGQRVLEIGAGTGYNAALLAHLVGETGCVVTVDIDEDLVAGVQKHLAACGLSRVTAVGADGGFGWPARAPYDRIMLTVGAWDIAPAWIEQLAVGGRLVLPLSLRGVQRSVAFQRVDGHLESLSIRDCGFMPLQGAFAGPQEIRALGGDPGLTVQLGEERSIGTDALYAALTQAGDDVRSDVRVTAQDVWGGLGLWLALHEPHIAQLSATGPALERELVPPLIAFPGHAVTSALIAGRALAALVRLDGGEAGSFELGARPFGPAGQPLAHRLVERVRAWDGPSLYRRTTHQRVPARDSRAGARRHDHRQALQPAGAQLAADTGRLTGQATQPPTVRRPSCFGVVRRHQSRKACIDARGSRGQEPASVAP